MAVAETLGDFAWIVIFGIGFALLALVIGFIVYNFLGKKKAKHNLMKEFFNEMKQDSKLNLPEDGTIKSLYRVPLPFMGDYVAKIADRKERKDVLDELKEIFATQHSAIYLGEIIGFNKIDLIVTIEDLIMPENKDDDPLDLTGENTHKLTKEDIEELIDIVQDAGRYLNVITYKPKKKSILDFTSEEVVLVFDDQVLGLTSRDGIVTLLGQGTDRLMYFGILSGYSERLRVLLTYLAERGYVRYSQRILSSIVEVGESAMRLDTDSAKAMAFSALQSGMMGRKHNEPQGGMQK